MKTYTLINKEYFSFLKGYKDVTYSTKANSLEEAVDNLFTHLKMYKWTKTKIREVLNG